MVSSPSTIGSRRGMAKNGLGILVSRVLTTAVALVSVPIVISKVGLIGYGTWESIIAVSMLCNIFQSTISGTLLWKSSDAFGHREMAGVEAYARSAMFIAIVVLVVVGPAAWIGRHSLVALFHIPTQFETSASWILPSVVCLIVAGSINEVMGAVIGGCQRVGSTTLTQAIATICNNGVVILCLVLGMGMYSLLIGVSVGFLVSAIGLRVIVRQVCGCIRLRPQVPSRLLLRSVAPYAAFMLLGSISIALRDHTDKVVLSSVASPLWLVTLVSPPGWRRCSQSFARSCTCPPLQPAGPCTRRATGPASDACTTTPW